MHLKIYVAKASMVMILVGASLAFAQDKEKPRIFVTDSQSWETNGGFAGNRNGVAGHQSGGARPQTAEIIKTFGERCDPVTVTSNKDRADYVLLLDHEGGKGIALKDNK